MKITQNEIVDRQTLLHIELDEADVDPYIDRGYRRLVKRVNIPGFRKGKAPRSILERFLGRDSLLRESLDQLVAEVTSSAIEEQNLDNVGRPSVELVSLDPVTIEAKVALVPDVDIGSYVHLRVQEESVNVSEDDINQRLEELRNRVAPWQPVERPVQLGDMVTMDVLGLVDGQTMLDQKDSVIVAEAGAVVPLPGFSEQIVGAEVNAGRTFEIQVSDDYSDASLAGKVVHFSVQITDVKMRILPEMDDEFAKSVGENYGSFQELVEKVKEDVEEEASRAQITQYREASIEALSALATVNLPPLLIDNEVDHMVERRNKFVEQLNIRQDDYLRYTGKTEDETRLEMVEQAVERLSRSYALASLAEKESLEVSDEEINSEIKRLSSSDGGTAGGRNLDSPEIRSSIRETLLVEKAVNRLTSITRGELSGDELTGTPPKKLERNMEENS